MSLKCINGGVSYSVSNLRYSVRVLRLNVLEVAIYSRKALIISHKLRFKEESYREFRKDESQMQIKDQIVLLTDG